MSVEASGFAEEDFVLTDSWAEYAVAWDVHVWERDRTDNEDRAARALETLTLIRPIPEQLDMDGACTNVVDSLTKSSFDFRTVGSLAAELGLSERSTRLVLNELERRGLIRRPYARGAAYRDWYRLSSRGPTWRERLGVLRAVAGRDSY